MMGAQALQDAVRGLRMAARSTDPMCVRAYRLALVATVEATLALTGSAVGWW